MFLWFHHESKKQTSKPVVAARLFKYFNRFACFVSNLTMRLYVLLFLNQTFLIVNKFETFCSLLDPDNWKMFCFRWSCVEGGDEWKGFVTWVWFMKSRGCWFLYYSDQFLCNISSILSWASTHPYSTSPPNKPQKRDSKREKNNYDQFGCLLPYHQYISVSVIRPHYAR